MSLKGAATACPEAPLVVTAGKNATQVDQVDLLENAREVRKNRQCDED